MAHIGSGSSSEINASLNILADLVKSHIREISRYAVFIKVRELFVEVARSVFFCFSSIFIFLSAMTNKF